MTWLEKRNPVIWKEQVALLVGAASSRDHLISRLEAAPTEFFYGNLDFPDKRQTKNFEGQIHFTRVL